MERNTAQWTVSLPPQLSKKALKIAKEESRTKSELMREALRAYLGRKERFNQLRQKFARKLEEQGIKTLEDVERMVDEGRD